MNKRKANSSNGNGISVLLERSNPLTVGLDIGYGVVKAVTSDATVMFPSVAGHAREIKFRQEELTARYPGEQIIDEEGAWFTGDLALAQIPIGELLRLRGRTSNEASMGNAFRLRLAKVAIGKLLAGTRDRDAVHLRIASGLPCDHMRDAEQLKSALLGQHLIQTDAADFVANVVEVMVMPQPYGTIYSRTLNSSGDINTAHTAMRTGVCDVGTYTVDVALDDDGEYIDAESGSTESGVYTAQERIAAALERDYRQKMPYKLVEETLRTGVLRASGERVDYRQEVEEALAPLRSATLNLLNEKWKAGAAVDVIYLSGGGAELVFREVMSAYPQTQLIKQAQLANAQGYLNYARFVEKQP